MKESGPKIVDLFCGVGGFSLGAHYAGMRSVLCIDIDEDVTSSYSTNFPNTKLLHEDISLIEPSRIENEAGVEKIDGLVAGPPCQGFSYMGKRNPNDPRNRLITHFFRIVKAIGPKFFIMENVPGILSSEHEGILKKGLASVAKNYRLLGPMLLNAADFGAATNRVRMFIIGYLPKYFNNFYEPDIRRLETKPTSVRAAIADLPSPSSAFPDETGNFWIQRKTKANGLSAYAKRACAPPPHSLCEKKAREKYNRGFVSGFQPTVHTEAVKKRLRDLSPGSIDRISKCPRLSWEQQCGTLRAGTGKDKGNFQAIRPIHPVDDRVISVREAARLQGFPDWFQFHPTKWHSFRMIGNSVSPNVSYAVSKAIVDRLKY